jgi:phosphatidylserine/phosphatidylglycerophosphate/cardiolipin synthase-like enzyme
MSITIPHLWIPDAKVVGGLLLVVAVIHFLHVVRRLGRQDSEIVTHFSPKGGCMNAIVAELSTARSEVLVQAYSFTCPDIAKALIDAAARRVKVVVLLDRSNEEESYSGLGDLQQHGIEVWIDACHAIAHNKVMVIDQRTVITGSFNFTRQAENNNAENLLILRHHHDLAVLYRANFHVHKEHCQAPGKAAATDSQTRTDQGHTGGKASNTHVQDRAHRAA